VRQAFLLRWISCAIAAPFLVACGGGGDGDGSSNSIAPGVSASTATPAGIWTGRTDIGRSLTGVVLDDGSYWVMYSAANNSAVLAGVVQGTGSAANGTFSSSSGRDFNLEGSGMLDLSVAANYVAQSAFNGRLSYTLANATTTFTSTYDSTYQQPVALTTVAGSYSGTAGVADGTEGVLVTISSTGAISGSGSSGCTFSGSVAPRPAGSVFNLSITFRGGLCSNGTSTVNGVGYFDTRTGRLLAAALNGSRSNGLLFSGQKAGFVPNATVSAASLGSSANAVTATTTSSSSGGCGSRGGPGYRKANGDCASWADYYAGRR